MRDEFNPGVRLGACRVHRASVPLASLGRKQGRKFDLEAIIEPGSPWRSR